MDLETVARTIVQQIDIFDKQCAESEYTDTGKVWELLDAFRLDLTIALNAPAKQEA